MKQYYCFLEKFNNYFNRKIIMFSSLEDYTNQANDFFIPSDTNDVPLPFDFNPNDNVMTEIIANDVPFTPDYFLLLDEEQNIVSRWFVLEEKRNRQGQWIYILRRDVVSDNIDTLYNAPIFVQKGMLPETDSFIVNDEGLSLNQIKIEEQLIKDESDTAWIIAYIAKNEGGSDISVQVDDETIDVPFKTLEDIETDIGLDEGILSSLVNIDDETSILGNVTDKFKIEVALRANNVTNSIKFSVDFDLNFNYLSRSTITNVFSRPYICDYYQGGWNLNVLPDYLINAVEDNKISLLTQIQTILNKSYMITTTQYNSLKTYQGTIIKYSGKYYKLNISEAPYASETVSDVDASLFSSLDSIADEFIDHQYLFARDTKKFSEISSSGKTFYLQLQYISDSDIVPQLNTIISSGRKVTADQEFDILAIPLSCKIDDGLNIFTCVDNYARRIASQIGLDENAKLYDLQLLPYCPIYDIVSAKGKLDISTLTEHSDFDFIQKNTSETKTETIPNALISYTISGTQYVSGSASKTVIAPAGSVITVEQVRIRGRKAKTVRNIQYSVAGHTVSITFDLNEVYEDPDLEIYIYFHNTLEDSNVGIIFYIQNASFTITTTQSYIPAETNRKILSNCYAFRLVSPNYQGTFEFNIAKNGGSILSYNIFCTYKPYTPLIKVAPEFSYLYGREFQDNRGLICAGDFSLPRLTSEWVTYQLNNKNYQNIFNRDIQHMEYMQRLEMRNQLVSGAVAILGDTAKGAGTGAFLGGGWGALVGGVIGGTASGVGYGIDVDTLARTQRENKQLAIDKYNYQLGNIKALPYTLTKVGSFDAISKIFPFLEVYKCSDEELEAFKNKIKYESMTVMRVGTLSEFMNFNGEINYFKGELIRNDEIADDPHTLNAIYEELLKGVYI